MASPLEISVVLHHHCGRGQYHLPSPAYSMAVDHFLTAGILERDPDGVLQTTQRGKAYVELLLTTPWPVSSFVDPRTNMVIQAD